MTADIIDLRPIFAGSTEDHDVRAMAQRVADRAFVSALDLLDSAYDREYRKKRLQQVLYAMEHADEACRSSFGGD